VALRHPENAESYANQFTRSSLSKAGMENVKQNAEEFSRALFDMGAFIKEGMMGQVIRKTALDLYSRIAQRTPVDTGRARAGWFINTAKGEELPPENPGGKSGADSAVAQKARAFGYQGEPVIYIYNNVAYIEVLENGWSKQAPMGMVAVSLHEFTTVLEDNYRQFLREIT